MSLTEYSDYVQEREKKQQAYLHELEQLKADQDPKPVKTTGVLVAAPCAPGKIPHYDEPLTDILFRDNTNWEKVVTSYAAVLRWREKVRDKQNIVVVIQPRAMKKKEQEALQMQTPPAIISQSAGLQKVKTRRLAVSSVEFYNAELKLLRLMQKTYEPDLFDTLQKNPDMISEGLAWCPRLKIIISRSCHAATLQERVQGFGKHLIYIPLTYKHNGKKYLNRVAELLMIHSHEQSGHSAAKGTLANFRIRFWVSKGTALAKWAKKRCPPCI
jgi:hypothetical protein